jgi:hypothetical protein
MRKGEKKEYERLKAELRFTADRLDFLETMARARFQVYGLNEAGDNELLLMGMSFEQLYLVRVFMDMPDWIMGPVSLRVKDA